MKPQGFEQNIISAPNDERRQQITTIISWSVIALCASSMVSLLAYHQGETPFQMLQSGVVQQVGSVNAAGILIAVISLLLLRAHKIMLPGALMTVSFFALILGGDDFVEIAGGRSTIFLTLPVLIAAITIRPYAAFIAAGVSTVILALHPAGVMEINVYAIGAIWMLALFIWLATALMEKAILTAQLETQRVRAMLGVVSHELRTPLGSINGYSDLLALSGAMSVLQSEMLGRIKSSSSALTDMVNRILDTAHIQSGKMTLKPARVSIEELFSSLRTSAERQTAEKGLEFQFSIEDMPEFISIDPLRFQQVITNLLDNALKYTEKGMLAMRVHGEGSNMQIMIRDTGIGIPKESLQAVFQEFVQVEHFTTREHGGVGLGLFIVQNLVSLMDGSIDVESEVRQGTTFTLNLPLHSSDQGDTNYVTHH